jgi:hypothetical protein
MLKLLYVLTSEDPVLEMWGAYCLTLAAENTNKRDLYMGTALAVLHCRDSCLCLVHLLTGLHGNNNHYIRIYDLWRCLHFVHTNLCALFCNLSAHPPQQLEIQAWVWCQWLPGLVGSWPCTFRGWAMSSQICILSFLVCWP